jgi:hypothetical protein
MSFKVGDKVLLNWGRWGPYQGEIYEIDETWMNPFYYIKFTLKNGYEMKVFLNEEKIILQENEE